MSFGGQSPPRVAIIGCGLIGRKRAGALGSAELVGCFDIRHDAAESLAVDFGGRALGSAEELLRLEPDIVIVATVHNELSEIACAALEAGAHVLVEKPAGISVNDVEAIQARAAAVDRRVKVGFNHRFHPGIMRAIEVARSGRYGNVFYLRGRYGHGGRLGYEKEWRADPAISGGGEIVDQGMHLLDLSYWLHGELPVAASLMRTQFWDAPVDDNAVLLLGEQGGIGSKAPFSLLHVSWTEWKNTFSLEIACETAKFAVDGLVRSYGSQVLRIYEMRPELGPPDVEEIHYPERDASWEREWQHFLEVIDHGGPLLGDLDSAHYAWSCVEAAKSASM
jgi:predicted dehydrogenase